LTRRSWLAVTAAWLGGALTPVSAMSPRKTGRYQLHRVEGARALALWDELRNQGPGYPVILGSSEEADGILYGLDENIEHAAARLTAAETLNFPNDLRKLRAEERSRIRAQIKPENQANFDRDWSIPEVGEWPTEPVPQVSEPAVLFDMNGLYRDVVVVVLPANDASEALAMLNYAPGEYETVCPIEHHIAALRDWQADWGFELVSCYRGVIEGRVKRRPTDRQAALALARVQYEYCPDVVNQGVGSQAVLAATLQSTDWWYFWWD
jgi:Domain of unknown function (DUF4253)